MKSILSLLGRGAASGNQDFDPDFYRAYYNDLKIFKKKSELLKHYISHGRAEGRFPSLSAAREHFARIHGPLPTDFDVELYRALNPDLAKLYSESAQFELHFLQFGRFENRPYGASSGARQDTWQSLLNLYEFNLLNEDWLPPGGVDRARAIAAMDAGGIDRLAPIACERIFDPAFCRARYGIEEQSDAALYREWLQSGFPAGRAPNEISAIFSFMGGQSFPSCFDWRSFCRLKHIDIESPVIAKIKALETLFELPLDKPTRSCLSGDGIGRLFDAIGDYRLMRGRYREAAEAYRLVCASGDATAKSFLRAGDALATLGKDTDALQHYQQSLGFSDCSIWALIHAAKLMLKLKLFRDAIRLVQTEAHRFRGHEFFDGFVDEVAGTIYEAIASAMHGMIAGGAEAGKLDAYAEDSLSEVAAFIRATKFPDKPLNLRSRGRRRVVMLACLDLPQCTFYRVEQKKRLLEKNGIEVEIFDFNDPSAFLSIVPGADAAIFYRVPCYPKIVEAIFYTQCLGIPTYFDIDDLIFTRDYPDTFESYEQQITLQEYFGLQHGVALYRQAISLCEGAIVSTVPLAEQIGTLVGGGSRQVFVVPNGLDDRSEIARRYANGRGEANGSVSIFYGSGTKAHNKDFTDLIAPALLEIFASYPNCRLVLVGYLRLDERFDPYADRISRFPFIGDLNSYWAILASCDINIAVLQPGAIADCKSEIKWLEAAMLGIPSIVSATRTFEDLLAKGGIGFLAGDQTDWLRHLRSLIDNPDLRRSVGTHAREFALREYGPSAITEKLISALFRNEESVAASLVNQGGRRKRLLICNVFFSPQSHGGATRVVEDNVNQLLDRYFEEFEISILSTYNGLKVGALRVDSYRGCPVYRIGTPVEVNMDWRPFNEEQILPAFRRILKIAEPDLIHFHCVQRLTASIVEETLRAKIPYVVTAHDAWWISDYQFLVDQEGKFVPLDKPFHTPLPAGISRPQSLERRQRLKSLLNAASATLAVSRDFGEIYRQAGICNVQTCENGLGSLPEPREKITPNDKIVLGHIGGRAVHKGASLVEIVLRSNQFKNLELLMIDGSLDIGEERSEIWGGTHVKLRAPINSAKVNDLYSQIDVLLAPSTWPESYGLVAREALFYNTWVIAGDQGAMSQDIIEGANGFIVETSTTRGLTALLSQIDLDVVRFKAKPAETIVRNSASQVDELVTEYQKILSLSPIDDHVPTAGGPVT